MSIRQWIRLWALRIGIIYDPGTIDLRTFCRDRDESRRNKKEGGET